MLLLCCGIPESFAAGTEAIVSARQAMPPRMQEIGDDFDAVPPLRSRTG